MSTVDTATAGTTAAVTAVAASTAAVKTAAVTTTASTGMCKAGFIASVPCDVQQSQAHLVLAPHWQEHSRVHTAQDGHVELHICLRTCTARSVSPYHTMPMLYADCRSGHGCSPSKGAFGLVKKCAYEGCGFFCTKVEQWPSSEGWTLFFLEVASVGSE